MHYANQCEPDIGIAEPLLVILRSKKRNRKIGKIIKLYILRRITEESQNN